MVIPYNPNKSNVEKVERKLYSSDYVDSGEKRSPLHDKRYSLNNSWGDENRKKDEGFDYDAPKKIGMFGWILILALLFFIGSVSYAGFVFFKGTKTVSSSDVDIKVIAPVSVGGGEVLSMDVVIANNSAVPLELVDLIVEYPDGTKDAKDRTVDLKRERQDVGDIPAGGVVKRTVNAALFGEEGTTENINFIVEYRTPSSNAIFEKERNLEIGLSASPIRVTTSGLEEISSGQSLEITVDLDSNSTETIENVMLVAEYPFGFEFANSDIKPTFGNNVWVFDKLFSKEKKQIKIIGQMVGQNNEDRIFRFNSGIRKEENEEEIGVLFTSVVHPVGIKKAFVDLALNFNNQSSPVFISGSGDRVGGEIVFTNNTNDHIQDLEIEIKVEGGVFDESSVSVTDGYYRSVDNTFIWDKSTSDIFNNIDPRDSQRLVFSFKTLDLDSGKIMFKNPEVHFSAKINGRRIGQNNVEEQVVTDTFKTLKLVSDAPTDSYTLFEQGPFSNSGPIPPKADVPTTYTVVLEVRNNSNDLKNAKVVGYLPTYVSWKGNSSPSSENISYDSVSRKVEWNIGDIPLSTGYIKSSKIAYLQLELLPSISQVGDVPSLINSVALTAEDSFTGTFINETIHSPDTTIRGKSIVNRHQNVVE